MGWCVGLDVGCHPYPKYFITPSGDRVSIKAMAAALKKVGTAGTRFITDGMSGSLSQATKYCGNLDPAYTSGSILGEEPALR